MRQAVFKYEVPLPASHIAEVEMPVSAAIIRVGSQGDNVYVWAIVDLDNDIERRRLMTVPTGYVLTEHALYHGTAEIYGGTLVVHVFEPLPKIPDPPPPPRGYLEPFDGADR